MSSVRSQPPGSRVDFWLLFTGVSASSVIIVCPRSNLFAQSYLGVKQSYFRAFPAISTNFCLVLTGVFQRPQLVLCVPVPNSCVVNFGNLQPVELTSDSCLLVCFHCPQCVPGPNLCVVNFDDIQAVELTSGSCFLVCFQCPQSALCVPGKTCFPSHI